mmetsp:Transcript_21959/g.55281  ORF Transcript_21959/g.55281 Transcript_21959/m.55281 type:complete len:207 (-) Transcript_21959:641-1261(-)
MPPPPPRAALVGLALAHRAGELRELVGGGQAAPHGLPLQAVQHRHLPPAERQAEGAHQAAHVALLQLRHRPRHRCAALQRPARRDVGHAVLQAAREREHRGGVAQRGVVQQADARPVAAQDVVRHVQRAPQEELVRHAAVREEGVHAARGRQHGRRAVLVEEEVEAELAVQGAQVAHHLLAPHRLQRAPAGVHQRARCVVALLRLL